MICYHRALFRNETRSQICHFFISPHLFNPRIRRQRYNHKDGVDEHNWAPFRSTRMCAILICFLLLTILLTFCATQMKTTLLLVSQKCWVGVGNGVGMPLPFAKLRFYSFARQLGKLRRCICSLLQLAPCSLYYSKFCYTMPKLIKTPLFFNAVKVSFLNPEWLFTTVNVHLRSVILWQ